MSGIKEINEPLISVYNNYKIKAAANFNNKIAYTYELALPLKYIKPLIGEQSNFNYTVTLNGSLRAEGAVYEIIEGGTHITSTTGNMPSMADMRSIAAPTYFSGQYTGKKINGYIHLLSHTRCLLFYNCAGCIIR